MPTSVLMPAAAGSATNDRQREAIVQRLHQLYHDSSKHSVYQSVPKFIARALGYQEEIHRLWRSDQPRLDYFVSRLTWPEGQRVADIGANTGYFALNIAHSNSGVFVDAFELNPRHAEFIRLAAQAFNLNRVSVSAQSCDYAGLDVIGRYDVLLLLNVLHHAGFDFDHSVADNNAEYTGYAVAYLAKLRQHAGTLIFQIGSNRGGDKTRPVHDRDDDVMRLEWTAGILRASGWMVSHIGYAQLVDNAVVFVDTPAAIVEAANNGTVRSESTRAYLEGLDLQRFPGEFHRRPMIIAQREESAAA